MNNEAKIDRPHRAATIGMFDGVHIGHRHLIDTLIRANTADLPPGAVTFTDHPLVTLRPEAAPALLTPPDEKANLLRSLGVHPCMMQFDRSIASMSAKQFMQLLKERYDIDRLVLGFNNRFGHDKNLSFTDYCRLGKELGIEVIQAAELPSPSTVSSSAIRQCLLDGEVARASEMLSRPYSLTGTVEHGQHLGSKIGFPTANLNPDSPRQLIPATGVYAAKAITDDGTIHTAAVNIGYRPTVDRSASPLKTIEAHLIDFTGDLYDRKLTLEFTIKIRDERRFDSIDDLRRQLDRDISQCLSRHKTR